MLQPTNDLMNNHEHGNRHQPSATPAPQPGKVMWLRQTSHARGHLYFHVSRAGAASLVPPWSGKIRQDASFRVLAVLFRKR
jgi:hypothetical protein